MQQEVIELLVINAKQGDIAALERLYRHYYKPMRRYAVLRVRDVMVAEDLVQEVWSKVGKRLRHLNNIALFQSWLYRALNWQVLDWIKSAKTTSFDAQEFDQLTQEQALDLNSLLPMFASLDCDERDIAELHYLNGLALVEASLALDIPLGTAKSRLFRARNKLRKWMDEESIYEN
jgi:RNA polymerase sigma-70 factor (ECF subfamily)